MAAASLVPEIEDAGLDNKPEQVLEGFECRVEPLGQDRLLSVAHIVVQNPSQLPEEVNESGVTVCR